MSAKISIPQMAAFTLFFLAIATFSIPTIAGLIILIQKEYADPELVELMLPLFKNGKDQSIEFLQDYWTAIPALASGALIANPSSRKVGALAVFGVMIFVFIFGTLTLNYQVSDQILAALSTEISGSTNENLLALKAIPEQIEKTHSIAVPFLAALVSAAISNAKKTDSHNNNINLSVVILLTIFCFSNSEKSKAEETEYKLVNPPHVDIKIVPRGLDDIVHQLAPKVSAKNLKLVDTNKVSFDDNEFLWPITTETLDSYITELTLELANENDPKSLPDPPIPMALPYSVVSIRIVIPASANEPIGKIVRDAYQEPAKNKNTNDLLTDFMHADTLIEFLTQGSSAEHAEHTLQLARALVVYSESLHELIKETEWFGIPVDIDRKSALLRYIIGTAAKGKRPWNDKILKKLRASKIYLELAQINIYGRIWRKLNESDDTICKNSFPVIYDFYKHLRSLDPDTYESIRERAQFSRTNVLQRSMICFRKVISRDEDGKRYVLTAIQEETLKGIGLSTWTQNLTSDLQRELKAVRRESGQPSPTSSCEFEDVEASKLEKSICESINYLEQLAPLIVENSDV